MIVNTAQGGGGGVKLNLFAQPDEPPEKDGLWVQTPEKHDIKQITTKDSFIINGLWNFIGSIYTDAYDSLKIPYDNKLYIAGLDSGSYPEHRIYCYDLTTGTSSAILTGASFPYVEEIQKNFFSLCKSRNEIILVTEGFKDSNNCYRLKTVIDIGTWQIKSSKYTSASYDFASDFHISTCSCYDFESGKSYCIKWGSDTDTLFKILSYDPDTDTEQILHSALRSSEPDAVQHYPKVIVSGNTLYITSSYRSYNICMFDITTGTLAECNGSNQPKSLTADCAIGCDLFYVTNNHFGPEIYQYNVSSDTLKNNLKIAKYISQKYTFLCTKNSKELVSINSNGDVYGLSFQSEDLQRNTLALLPGTDHICKLITTDKMNYLRTVFGDVWWYDTDFREYPTYIGDGTQWNKIKN